MLSSASGDGGWSKGKKIAVVVTVAAGIGGLYLLKKWREARENGDKPKDGTKSKSGGKAEKPDIIPVQDKPLSTRTEKQSTSKLETTLEPVAMKQVAATTETIHVTSDLKLQAEASKEVERVEEFMEQKAGDSPFISLKLESLGSDSGGQPMQFSPDIRNEGQGDVVQGLSPPTVSLNLADSSTFEKVGIQPLDESNTSTTFEKLQVLGDSNNSSSFEKISVSDSESNDVNNTTTQSTSQTSDVIQTTASTSQTPTDTQETVTSQLTPTDKLSSPDKSKDVAKSPDKAKAESECSDIESVPEEDIQEASSSEEETQFSTTTASIEISPEKKKKEETKEEEKEADEEYEDDFESDEEDEESEKKEKVEKEEKEEKEEKMEREMCERGDAPSVVAEPGKQG